MTELNVMADVADAIRDAFTAVENALNALAVIDWVLIALAIFLLYWAGALLWAVANLGPVEVELIEHDGEEAANPVKSLTAGFRERLADSGLAPPPTVPAGAPQTDLIAAVEASPVPQGAWIAKLLDFLDRATPHPPRYRLTATLVPPEPAEPAPTAYKVRAELAATEGALETPAGESNNVRGVLTGMAFEDEVAAPESDGSGDGAANIPSRVSFWLKPSREGRPLLRTVSGDDYKDALAHAVSCVFVHISREAVLVFPAWSRWRTTEGFDAYLEGIKALEDDLETAFTSFEVARIQEPRNMLPRLQLATLFERTAADNDAQEAEGRHLTDALAEYLEIATEQPSLVEARYRASVVAATLVSMTGALTDATRSDLATALGVEENGPAPLREALEVRAKIESRAVLKLLQPYYTLLREGRLRSRYEPQGADRRELKRAVAISRQCLGLRSLGTRKGTRASIEVWRRRAIVRGWHMFLGRSSIGWQAHYNAACFYALLHKRRAAMTAGGGQ